MNIQKFLGNPKTLAEWVKICINSPGAGHWLIFKDPDGNTKITLSTLFIPITGNTGDLSDEEFDEFDSSIVQSGDSNFVNLDQLEDIISNLTMQKKNYSKIELLDAIEYYFTHDAFIDMTNG
jgi:hypothetical protein